MREGLAIVLPVEPGMCAVRIGGDLCSRLSDGIMYKGEVGIAGVCEGHGMAVLAEAPREWSYRGVICGDDL